jgi:hypothetical protein
MNLTGKSANKAQAIAMRTLRGWTSVIPLGDSISFTCECVANEKQFRVWKKWFEKHENNQWIIDEKLKLFFFYRSLSVE